MMDKRFFKTGSIVKVMLFFAAVMFIFGQGIKADANQKFVVGFDASFPPSVISVMTVIMWDSTLTLLQKWQREMDGSLLNSRLTGMLKILS